MIISDVNIKHNKVFFRQGQEVTATDKFPEIEIQRLLKRGRFKKVEDNSPEADRAREIAKKMKAETDKKKKKVEDRKKEERELEEKARKAKENEGKPPADDAGTEVADGGGEEKEDKKE